MQAVVVDHINKCYADKVAALRDVSFTVNQGEIFGLVGPDGAGKTSLFNIMTTLLFADTGTVTLLDNDVENDYKKVRSIIGYLPGVFSLYPDLTVEENLRFFATMYKSSLKDNMPIIRPIWGQLSPFKTRKAGKLSGGMKQKLALCCALIHKPEILFLDEPTTGVDPVSRKEFWDILKSIQKQNITVVVSTPYMDEATRCDRIALIQNGEIIKIDPPVKIVKEFNGTLYSIRVKQIFETLDVMERCPIDSNFYPYGEYVHVVFYDKDTTTIKERFAAFLNENGVEYTDMEEIAPSIEDCFIELMERRDGVQY
ncbi:ABC transporter ATP-binding protein [Bacteroidales bacterium OttesenSCG-928-B11]|nr:ABC transporter ATP-binding protein [Bacteroidales bacterium OttesenSCG-928-C03]MDL2311583.1 ABC transporter ATP-binding protein [Bacteroidales bacterium OttesenSCG-928-B11]